MATLGIRLCEECGNCDCCKIKEIYKENIKKMEALANEFKEPEDYGKCFVTDIMYNCAFYDWHKNYR